MKRKSILSMVFSLICLMSFSMACGSGNDDNNNATSKEPGDDTGADDSANDDSANAGVDDDNGPPTNIALYGVYSSSGPDSDFEFYENISLLSYLPQSDQWQAISAWGNCIPLDLWGSSPDDIYGVGASYVWVQDGGMHY